MSCGVGHRRGLDPTLLWLWRRLAATADSNPSLGTSICQGSSPRKGKKTKKKKKLTITLRWDFLWEPWDLGKPAFDCWCLWISLKSCYNSHGRSPLPLGPVSKCHVGFLFWNLTSVLQSINSDLKVRPFHIKSYSVKQLELSKLPQRICAWCRGVVEHVAKGILYLSNENWLISISCTCFY